jgi:hypothetical protein
MALQFSSSIAFMDSRVRVHPSRALRNGLLELPLRRPKAFRLGESWKTRICTLDEIVAETSEKQVALL